MTINLSIFPYKLSLVNSIYIYTQEKATSLDVAFSFIYMIKKIKKLNA